jgi:mono/diheme cytochrome c family protein
MESSVRKLAKYVGIAVLLLVVVAAIGITFTIGWRPFIGPRVRPLTNRTFERTPQRLERGRYLAVAVAGCVGCHSEHDWKNGGAIPPGMEGAGEVMPITELRSLPARRRSLPKSEIIFPVKYLIRSVPQPLTAPVPTQDLSDPVHRGKYLVTMAGCAGCHTPQVRGQSVPGMELAGGFTMTGPWGSVATSNITPDPSGIGYYDESLFLQAMRTGYVRARELSPIMPVFDFKNMTDDDLKAMFAYLRTLKPVKHHVDNAEEVGECKLCRLKHGAGKLN